MRRKLEPWRPLATLICLIAINTSTGCGGAAAPMPLTEYDDIKNDPELAAIAASGKGPKAIREEIRAKIRSRQLSTLSDAKSQNKKKKKQ